MIADGSSERARASFMRGRHVSAVIVIGGFFGGALAACSPSNTGTDPIDNVDALADSSGGDDADGGGIVIDGTIGDRKVVKLDLDPATATLEVVNGDVTAATTKTSFEAKATLDDGSTSAVGSCTWTVDRIDLGTVSGGTFQASGSAGGVAKVTCAALGFTASATVTVNLRDVEDKGSGLDDASKTALLAATTADAAVAKLLYPYDKTVFPKGILAPELMWAGGGASDVYALQITQPNMTYTSYFKAGTPPRATIAGATWTRLLDTNVTGDKLAVTLYRLAGGAGGTAFKSTTQSWTIANGSLKGSIYYWRINGGGVARIKPGAIKPEDFLKPSAGHSCVACHSVAKNGSTIVASYDGGPSPWASFDSTGKEIKYSGSPSGFQAISADGNLVVAGQSQETTLKLFDAKTAGSLEPSGVAAAGMAVMPTFANDSSLLAYSLRKNGNWLDFTQSDLMVMPFDLPTRKFGAPKTVRAGGGKALLYPSFSPDNQWIAYEEGPMARTRGTRATVRLIKPDGTGDVLLGNAVNAGVTPGTSGAGDENLAYEPTFNPVLAGGYFWLVFVSERQYGNRLNKTLQSDADTCGKPSWAATPCRHKQLWVTAIDASPKAGVDPSHPAFWLTGQDLADQNMRGYWALDACKKLGEGCDAGFECCDGACKSPDGKLPKVCDKPPPDKCKEIGDTCVETKDCCNAAFGVECIGGVCGKKLPA